jgi:hypothetical protein
MTAQEQEKAEFFSLFMALAFVFLMLWPLWPVFGEIIKSTTETASSLFVDLVERVKKW